jgi:hypothetical protein
MSELKAPVRRKESYETDYYAWAIDQAERLRQMRPTSIDWENVAEEVESLGKSDKRAIGSDLKVLLEHLIKWRFQSDKRTSSWNDSIEEHRDRILRIVKDSPSLGMTPRDVLPEEYVRARRKALRDTKLPPKRVPESCPFTVEQVLDPEFFPDEEGR